MHLYHLGKQLCGQRMGYKPLTSTSTPKQGLKSTPLPHKHTSKFHSLDTTTKISEIFFFPGNKELKAGAQASRNKMLLVRNKEN